MAQSRRPTRSTRPSAPRVGYSPGTAGSLTPVSDIERPLPDPTKLLGFWMEWERGTDTPGTVLKNLKNGGMKELLETLAAAVESS